METRFTDDQIDIFGGLGLRAAKTLTHGSAQVPYLNQHTKFPVRHIVQVNSWRQHVIAQIASGLIQQCFCCGDQRGSSRTANHILFTYSRQALIGSAGDGKRGGLPAPVESNQQYQDDDNAKSSENESTARIAAN
jgi:hypothetical protein